MKLEIPSDHEKVIAELLTGLSIADTIENREAFAKMMFSTGMTTICMAIGFLEEFTEKFPTAKLNKESPDTKPLIEVVPYRCPQCKTVLCRPFPGGKIQCNCRKWDEPNE